MTTDGRNEPMSLYDKIKQAAASTASGDVKEIAKNAIDAVNLSIPVPANYIETLLLKSQPENISDLAVTYSDDVLVISGKTKKALFKIPFDVRLKPEHSQDRILIFSIDSVSPIDLDWVNKRIFQMPPTLSYQDRNLYVNLNGIPAVAKVPFGKITKFGMERGGLWITLGI